MMRRILLRPPILLSERYELAASRTDRGDKEGGDLPADEIKPSIALFLEPQVGKPFWRREACASNMLGLRA